MHRAELDALLLERKSTCFAYALKDLTGYHGLDGPLRIELTTDDAIIQKLRRYSPAEQEIRDEKCIELRDANIITRAPPSCKYACCPTMPAKKNAEGDWVDRRFCIDYRPVNDKTKPDRYALHLPEELYRRMGNSTIFSKLDLRAAFHQVPIHPDDQVKTAFYWRNEMWMYNRMPYGLVNGSAKCQRMMDTEIVAAGLSGCCVCFVDDLVVYSDTPEQHLQHLQQVLDMLRSCGLRVHPDKSIFFADHIEFLGHNVSKHGLSPHEAKVAAIRALTSPTNISELRSKLQFMNYYRCYLPEFSTLAAPLNHLLQKDVPWHWGPEQESAYTQLRDQLCEPGLVLKRYDPSRQTIVYTDWSGVGIAAVLAQLDDEGRECMVACISRSLNRHERNYSSYEGEMLAAVWGVKSFRQYLHGVHFTLVTDHQPLKWLMRTPDLSGKHMRWSVCMQEFEFCIEHRPGSQHQNVDVPSRFPLPTTADSTGACLDPESPTHSMPNTSNSTQADPLHHLPYATPSSLFAAQPQGRSHHLPSPAPNPVAPFMDSYIPTSSHITPHPDGHPSDIPQALSNAPKAMAETRYLRCAGVVWVTRVIEQLRRFAVSQYVQWSGVGARDAYGVQPTVTLSTVPVGPSFLSVAYSDGIVLYEPFGGICSGLEAVLANGIAVQQYLYSDIDPAAQAVARSRVAQLHKLYPVSFPVSASECAFEALPMDVTAVDSGALVSAGARAQRQWLVVAGWSCEDLSPAGKGKGLAGARSSNFFDAIRIVGALQQLQPELPPAYVLENTSMQVRFAHARVQQDFEQICAVLGEPVLLDAARCGSYAHRLRNFWSNMADPRWVNTVVEQIVRPAGRLVDDVLGEGRKSQPVQHQRQPPFYLCNRIGEPLQALPTMVAYPASRAFRLWDGEPAPGMLWDAHQQQWVEPNPDERERILGYPSGCTAVQGITSLQRHALTGRAMDRHCMVHLFAVYTALQQAAPHVEVPAALSLLSVQAPMLPPLSEEELQGMYGPGCDAVFLEGWEPGQALGAVEGEDALPWPLDFQPNFSRAGLGWGAAGVASAQKLGGGSPQVRSARAVSQALQPLPFERQEHFCRRSLRADRELTQRCNHSAHCMHASSSAAATDHQFHEQLLQQATTAGQSEAHHRQADVWMDQEAVRFLKLGSLGKDASREVRDRVQRRAKVYAFVDGQLVRTMADGSRRVVPQPHERERIVQITHQTTGHFGIKRTKHLLYNNYWWAGLEQDVVRVLSECEVCGRVKASFNAASPELQPLPIEGMFYRWGVDLAGPFVQSKLGNKYVFVAVEYFSKQIEVVPIPDKTAQHTTAAFLSAVLARYGACAEVVTDQGSEFQGEFHALLQQAFIDHRTTSANHPQADGLAERAVQTIKRALTKCVADKLVLDDWDVELQWVALGYRTSKQASTGLSPYQMLYGTEPVIPPAVREHFEGSLDLVDQEEAARYVLQRAALLKQHCAIAMQNLRVAQHRDQLRYEKVRSGLYQPPLLKFVQGDFVYVRRRNVVNTLQSVARPGIYRVVQLLDSGVLKLQGRCGRTMKVHRSQCAPCHLTNINPVLDPSLQEVGVDFPCVVCGSPEEEGLLVICDGCLQGYHIHCLTPPLASVPVEDVWVCPGCVEQGVTTEVVQLQRQMGMPVAQSDAHVFPSEKQQAADDEARKLDGKGVWVKPTGEGRGAQLVEAKLEYVPRGGRPPHGRSPLKLHVPGKGAEFLTLRRALGLLQASVQVVGGEALLSEKLHDMQQAPVFVPARRGADGKRVKGSLDQVSAEWDLSSHQQIKDVVFALSQLHCTEQWSEQLLAAISAAAAAPECVCKEVSQSVVSQLLAVVDLRACVKVCAVGIGGVQLGSALAARYARQLQLPAEQHVRPLAALSPACYKQLAKGGPVDWVFLQVPTGTEEVALMLACVAVKVGVCMFLSTKYLAELSAVRQELLRRLRSQGRLALVFDVQAGWLCVCVFSSRGHREGMLSLGSGAAWVVT